MDELLALDANVQTALVVIATGVVVPVITSLLKRPGLSKTVRRAIPVGLSAIGAVVIVVLQAGGPVAEQMMTWLLLLATLVGIAQTIYAAMPSVWHKLEESTPPAEVKGTHRNGTS